MSFMLLLLRQQVSTWLGWNSTHSKETKAAYESLKQKKTLKTKKGSVYLRSSCLCSILKLFVLFFLTFVSLSLSPLPPFSLPHLSSLSHDALLSQFLYPFYFPPSPPHLSSYSSLPPYLLSSINVSTSPSIHFPHLFISLIHFPFSIFLSPFTCIPQSPSHPNPSLFLASSPFLHFYPISSWVLSIQPLLLSQSYQGKGISKSVSMNCGPCQGMPQGLSHSDSYTWAMENRRPSTARSTHRDGSMSSLGSHDLSFSGIYPDKCIQTESQVRENQFFFFFNL